MVRDVPVLQFYLRVAWVKVLPWKVCSVRVLIAEDDAALSMFLSKALELEGYRIDFATTGEAAMNSALADPPELLILDLNLPGRDGIEVLKALRQIDPPIGTLILTGRTAVEDRVQCLDLGADDYLQKPFSLQELTARCRAIQRRRTQKASTVITHGDLRLDRLHRTVERAGVTVELTAKEHAILSYFLEHRGRIVNRAELLANVFQLMPETQTNLVEVYISYLRSKLRVQEDAPPLIETVRGQGYLMRAHLGPGTKRPVQSTALLSEDEKKAANE